MNQRIALSLVTTASALLTAVAASAQPAAAAAQQRYERTLDGCNSGTLAAPAREACIRNAGRALDAARGGAPVDTEVESADGRATIIAPAGSATPLNSTDARTSSDGRATIVPPADRAVTR